VAPPHGAAGGVVADAVVVEQPVGRVGITLGREVPADHVLVPAGVVPALVVAAVGALTAARQGFLGGPDGVRQAVGHVGDPALRPEGRPDDDAFAAGGVAEVFRGAFVPPRAHAEGRGGDVPGVLVQLALEVAGVAGVVAAAEQGGAVAGGGAAGRAVVDL